jgi:hypothetical protein
MTSLNLFAFIAAVLLTPTVYTDHLAVSNFTKTAMESTTYETYPKRTMPVVQTVRPNVSESTWLPADETTIISLQFKQNGKSIVPMPILVSNVVQAILDTMCYTEERPCIYLKPASAKEPPKEIDAANHLLALWRSRTMYCRPGIVFTRNDVRYFDLANGLVMPLSGEVNKLPPGPACLCGVFVLGREPLGWDVKRSCDVPKS